MGRAGRKRVLAYHLPAGGYDIAIDLTNSSVDLATAWADLRRELVARALTTEIAVFLGADHHAMVPDIAGLRARFQALERVARCGSAGSASSSKRSSDPGLRIRRCAGELRSGDGHAWALQGVLSTRSRIKRRHAPPRALPGANCGAPRSSGR